MEELFFINKVEWRNWLISNYQSKDPIWLLFYKKGSGFPCMSYDDSVEQALCFGWIDGLIKGIDSQRFKRKFTPRTNFTQWSETNKKRVEKLLKSGEMTEMGLNKIGDYYKTGKIEWPITKHQVYTKFSSKLEEKLKTNIKAHLFFTSLSTSNQKKYINWVMQAKREETQTKRMNEAIELLEKETKILLK